MSCAQDPQITNTAPLKVGIFAPYVAQNIRMYKCPADRYLSAAQRAIHFPERIRSFCRSLLCASLATTIHVHAGTWTWTKSVGGNWSVAANWNPNSVPVSAAETALIFNMNAPAYNSTNDISAGLALNQLTFASSSRPVTLSGNPLYFTNNGATAPVCLNASVNPITLANDLYTTNMSWNMVGDTTLNGTLYVKDGGIPWNTRLTKTGAGKLILANAAAQARAFTNLNFFIDISQGTLQTRTLIGNPGNVMVRIGQNATAGATSSCLLTTNGDVNSLSLIFGNTPGTTNIVGGLNTSGTVWFNAWFYPSGGATSNTLAYLSAAAGGAVSINNLIDSNSSSKDASNSVVKIGAGTVEVRSGTYYGLGSWTNWAYRGNTTVRAGTLRLACNADGTASLGGAFGYNNHTVQLGDSLTQPSDTVALLCKGLNLLVTHPLSVNAYGAGTTIGAYDSSSLCTFTGNIALRNNLTVSAPNAAGTVGVTLSGNVSDAAGANSVIINGPGTVLFSGTNTYAGNTLINSGALALSSSGGATSVISNSAKILIPSLSTLDVSGIAAGFGLASGQTLSGLGTVKGSLKVGSGASLAPGQGFGAGLGSLTLTSNLTLSGNAVFRQIGSQSDQVVCSGTVHYGGTLTLSNLSSGFQVGDSFTLFPAAGGYAGTFDQICPAMPGAGLTWDLGQLNAGTVAVSSTGTTSASINPPLVNQTIEAGNGAPITAYARGSGSLYYQWSTNGTPIARATSRSFSPNHLSSGTYTLSVIVTNAYGQATSSATLTVQDTAAPAITMLGANPMTVMLNSNFVDPGATNYDRAAGACPMITNSTVNANTAGVYTVTYSATDPNGNTVTATRVVRVMPTTGLYVQPSMYPGVLSQQIADNLRNSGFNTVILFSFTVGANYITCGQVNSLIISNGVYVGDPTWPSYLATLKQAPTSVARVEVAFGGWGNGTFGTIRDLINTYGTNSNTTLYSNLMVLKAVTGADAVNFDDENIYDAPSAAQFSLMCASMGYKTKLCPYSRTTYWQSVVSTVNSARPGTVDSIQLQCYSGGAGNNPATWNTALGMKVSPGLESAHTTGSSPGCNLGNTPSALCSLFGSWRSSPGISGGWLWIYDYMPNSHSGWTGYCPTYSAADYSSGINCKNCTGNAGPITGSTNVSSGKTGVAYSIASVSGVTSYTWTVPSGAVIASGQGTTAITLNYGPTAASGTVSVWPANTNGCGGLGSSLGVTVTPVGDAGPILGPAVVAAGQTNCVYSIAAVGGATTYVWTVPVGATIVSGQGTMAITVNYGLGAASGYVSVTPSNGVGSSGVSASAGVMVTTAPISTPTSITFGVTGTNLNLSWPADHLGWRLLVQTNRVIVGLSTNWFTWPNSTNWTSVTIPILSANPSVFFRLVYP